MVNWGIIGLGNIANKFANSIKELKNCKLLGIASKDPWIPPKKIVVETRSKQEYYKSFINSGLDIYASQIDTVTKCILDGKKEADFPAMKWKDTINNMFILDKWKKKLFNIILLLK